LYTLIKPKYAIPVHGEYRHLAAHAELAKSVGIDKDNIFILHSGDVLEFSEDEAKIVDHITLHEVLVDGLGVGDVGNAVLRDRRELSESGLVIVSLAMGKGTNIVLAGPEINSRGFVYMRESEEKIEEAREVVEATLSKLLSKQKVDRNKLKNEIRDALSDHFWKTMKREPVILPIIMEVE
ncbi:MAG: ribonuclease J, partial [Lachnospiraceae bacterium]|nr:ribonuclease J [Lachnospiraceae bacterium]